jgi:hypothetical protein
MDDRKQSRQNANEQEERRMRGTERPDRAQPEPNPPEQPGGEQAGKAENDARNKAARRGER